MRNLIILILIGIALAVVRWLVSDVIRSVKRAVGQPKNGRESGARASREPAAGSQPAGHLVRDPVSGTYIDERLAIKQVIDGETFYFESRENRDAYLKQQRSG
jgi:YHS domain-containing protein